MSSDKKYNSNIVLSKQQFIQFVYDTDLLCSNKIEQEKKIENKIRKKQQFTKSVEIKTVRRVIGVAKENVTKWSQQHIRRA